MVWQLLKYFLLLYKAKRGVCPPLFKGWFEKYFVLYSKALSKMGLNVENHVYSSNGMAITEFSSDFENSFMILDLGYTHNQKISLLGG